MALTKVLVSTIILGIFAKKFLFQFAKLFWTGY